MGLSVKMSDSNRTILATPLEGEIRLIHPNNCLVNVHGKNIDVGALCYLDRVKCNTGYRINDSSLSQNRFKHIKSIIYYLSDLSESALSIVSIKSRFNNFTLFLDWCDSNSNYNIMNSFGEARNALTKYINYLVELIKTQKLHNNTAARYQYDAIIVLRDCFGYERVDQGLNLIKKSNRSITNTSSPDEKHQGQVLALSLALFKGFHKEIMNNSKYPFLISMPKGTGFENDAAWIFPTGMYVQHPANQINYTKGTYCAYDYQNGVIHTVDKILEHYASKLSAENSIRNAHRVLRKNDAEGTPVRLMHAAIAVNAFIVLFIANTGMNWSEVCRLTWQNGYEVGVDTQGFREIKYRAYDRTVTFIITSSFLPYFKAYLELRDYIQCHSEKTELLFFTISKKTSFKPAKLGGTKLPTICRSFQLFDPSLPIISAKQWRATKSDYLVRNTDLQTSSLLLQSDERTIQEHYTSGSETKGISEISMFLERIVSKVKEVSLDDSKLIESALGHCNSPGNPLAEKHSPIEPDCKKSEGCLFCKHYGVHADEIDIRKLYSCKFCIESTSHLSGSIDHYLKVFGEVLERIDALLSTFSDISENHRKIVERVKYEVLEEGELDPYWEIKYEQLINLGVV